MGPESEEKKEMLIIDGNAIYELDLECVRTVSYTHLTLPTTSRV